MTDTAIDIKIEIEIKTEIESTTHSQKTHTPVRSQASYSPLSASYLTPCPSASCRPSFKTHQLRCPPQTFNPAFSSYAYSFRNTPLSRKVTS